VDIEKLYSRLPILLQNIACSLEGFRIHQRRYGGEFSEILKRTEERSNWNSAQIIRYRNRRLKEYVHWCARTVPFYRNWFENSTVDPDDIRILEDLQSLPIVDKETIKSNYSDFVSQAIPNNKKFTLHTSGTTGSGLRFPVTSLSRREQFATAWRFLRWHGIEHNNWYAFFGGRSVVPISQTRAPFWRYNIYGKQILFSGYHMNNNNMEAYVSLLQEKKPRCLRGYPSLISLLASYIIDRDVDLGYRVRWIITQSESLLTNQRELIGRAFGVQPVQRYSMAEAVASVSECEYGNLHVDEDLAAVELLPNHSGGYKVIGTAFTNFAFAFIRYDVGDIVQVANKSCPCGKPGRIIESIDGRKEDYVILPSGMRLGRLDHIFKDIVNVRAAQLYQKSKGELIFRIVPMKGYSEKDERRILKEARKRLGNKVNIVFHYQDKLGRSKNGKLRFVISAIKENM
jgi:phenylacetate-CoA ligase